MAQHRERRRIRLHRVPGTIVPLCVVAVLLLVGCGSGQSNATTGAGSSVQRVNITLSEFTITSSQSTFQAGRMYQFVVTNKGTADHEFMTMPASMGGTHMGTMSMEDMHTIALFHIDAEDLPAGATKTVAYTFRNAAPAGQLEFTCYVPGHYELGMHAPIAVTPGA